ncbi:MAG: 60S ribosomal export protein NMD3 [Candidatus Aenigmarchaeota archaeon]|nr:60S ribosomal export protein NMD3 [Candidatus Aenigmarchaeota archaeon]
MNSKFCPSCGRDTDELFSGLCKRCFSGKVKLLEIPDKIEVKYCDCGRINGRRKWKYYETIGAAIKDAVIVNAKTSKGAKISADFRTPSVMEPLKIAVTATADAVLNGKTVSDSKDIFVFLSRQACTVCGKRRAGYYEAIIQIRGAKNKEVLELVQSELEIMFVDDESSYVSRVEEKKEGIDVYVGAKIPARKAIEKAKKIYNVETKRSYKLAGTKNGKPVSRETMLLRIKEGI